MRLLLRSVLIGLVVTGTGLVGVGQAYAAAVQALSDEYSTPMNTTLVVPSPGVLSNDGVTGGNGLVLAVYRPPSLGDVTLNQDGSFTYVPPQDYAGTQTWVYSVSQPSGAVALASVKITIVDNGPQVNGDKYTVGSGLFLNVPAPGVLANDSDPGGKALTVDLVSPTASGTVVMAATGAFTYLSNPGFCGTDRFEYSASNGVQTSGASVAIVVACTGPEATVGSGTAATAGGGVPGSAVSFPAPSGQPASPGGGGSASGTGGGTSGGSSSAPDLKVTVAKKRAAARKWALVATVANIGTGATTKKVTVTAVAAKGAKVTKVKAPRGWKCSIKKLTATCTLPTPMAKSAKTKIAYTVTTTKGTKRTVRVTALTAGDTVKKNNVVTVAVPAKN